jgi:hypothetical protein
VLVVQYVLVGPGQGLQVQGLSGNCGGALQEPGVGGGWGCVWGRMGEGVWREEVEEAEEVGVRKGVEGVCWGVCVCWCVCVCMSMCVCVCV